MDKDVAFGYEWKNGELVINEKNQVNVKWIYEKITEYVNNPPDYLIKEIMDHSEEKLSIQEACEKISLSQIEIYVLAELKVRTLQFKEQQADFNDIHKIMEMQLDEAMQAAVEEKYRLQQAIECSGGYIPEYERHQYVGNVFLPESKQGSYESLISRELYEKAVEKMREFREDGAEEQSNYLQQ